jgi:hypothetical protein
VSRWFLSSFVFCQVKLRCVLCVPRQSLGIQGSLTLPQSSSKQLNQLPFTNPPPTEYRPPITENIYAPTFNLAPLDPLEKYISSPTVRNKPILPSNNE